MVTALLGDFMLIKCSIKVFVAADHHIPGFPRQEQTSRARRDFEGGRLREGPCSLSEGQGFGTRNRYQEPVLWVMWITNKEGQADGTSPMSQPIRPAGQEPKGCKEVYLLRQKGKTSGTARLVVRNEIWVTPALRRGARWAIYNILSHLQAKLDPGCTVICSMAKSALAGLILTGLP